MKDWNLLVALLGPTGSCNLLLTAEESAAVRARCDGFGRMSIGELDALGALGDWSHVRDSSDAAIADAAALARRFVGDRMDRVEEIVARLGRCAVETCAVCRSERGRIPAELDGRRVLTCAPCFAYETGEEVPA